MQDLNKAEISKLDSGQMLNKISSFPDQLQSALEIAKSTNVRLENDLIRNICVSGMGGSAIGGDIVRSSWNSVLEVPFFVNRYYKVPNFVSANTLAIFSSYSGNTEETLSAYEDACARDAHIVCITSGGLLREKAESNDHPLFIIPGGAPPRSALGYLAVPLLYCLYYAALIPDPEADVLETVSLLNELREEYGPDVEDNFAKQLSLRLQNKIPLIYASVDGFEAVALRWKGQFSENGKVLAFSNVFPELNHNEIMGWGPLTEINNNFQTIYLKDRHDHARVSKRMILTKAVIEHHCEPIIEVESRGESLLARLFSLIYLGDMVSLYLAILNKVDPTSIKNIDYIKKGLAG